MAGRRVWRVAGVVAALAVGLVAWLALAGRPPALPDAEARTLATAFLEQVRTGKVDEAWASTGAEFKSLQGRDTFRAYVRRHKALLAPAELDRVEPRKDSPLPLTDCIYRAAGGGTVRVTLGVEDGAWTVAGLVVE